MQLLCLDRYRRVPWLNGRGETAEILVHPAGTSGGAVAWRISMAPVAESGPFSIFPGIDRVLTVIEGSGLELAIGDRPPVALTDAPFAFPGDLRCHAELRAGAIIDLNVMTRRGQWRAAVRWTSRPVTARAPGRRLAFAALGRLEGTAAGVPVSLGRYDTLALAPGETAALVGRWLDIELIPLSGESQ